MAIFEAQRTALVVENLEPHAIDVLHDGAPVEVGRPLVELDVAVVQPCFQRIKMLDIDCAHLTRACGVGWAAVGKLGCDSPGACTGFW